MSDLADDAEGVRILMADGAQFGKRMRGKAGDKLCARCKIGPVIRSLGNTGREVLICPVCGKQTEPLKSRQALSEMWNGMN